MQKLIPVNTTLLLADMTESGLTDSAIVKNSKVSSQYFTKLRAKDAAQKPASMRQPTLEKIARTLGHSAGRYVLGAPIGPFSKVSPGIAGNGTVAPIGNGGTPARTTDRRSLVDPAYVVRGFLSLNEEGRTKTIDALKVLGCL